MGPAQNRIEAIDRLNQAADKLDYIANSMATTEESAGLYFLLVDIHDQMKGSLKHLA
jgi:hypothetical protein